MGEKKQQLFNILKLKWNFILINFSMHVFIDINTNTKGLKIWQSLIAALFGSIYYLNVNSAVSTVKVPNSYVSKGESRCWKNRETPNYILAPVLIVLKHLIWKKYKSHPGCHSMKPAQLCKVKGVFV